MASKSLILNHRVKTLAALRLRSNPSLSSSIKLVIPPDSPVLVLNRAGVSDNLEWVYCQYKNLDGYVALKYLYEPLSPYFPVGENYLSEDWYITNPYLNTYYLYSLTGVAKKTTHTGIDLFRKDGNVVGKPVYAIEAGEVVFSGNGGGSWMGLVVLKHIHGSAFTVSRYAHLEAKTLAVKKGDIVKVRQVLGYLGETRGKAAFAPHLHFDVTRTNDPLLLNNPRSWFGFNPRKVLMHYQNPVELFNAD